MPATLRETREQTPPPAVDPAVALRGSSHQDRRQILPALDLAMHHCGCWVLRRGTLSSSLVELVFEIHLRSAFDLYGALIAAGVELTRDSHAALTGLCTLRRHHPASLPASRLGAAIATRIVTVRLEVSFFDEDEIEIGAVGLA
jgi:hypothetical protein